MAPDLATALADAVHADGAWDALRITLGQETVLEGDALRIAINEAAGSPLS